MYIMCIITGVTIVKLTYSTMFHLPLLSYFISVLLTTTIIYVYHPEFHLKCGWNMMELTVRKFWVEKSSKHVNVDYNDNNVV